jgi:hypothetical protein
MDHLLPVLTLLVIGYPLTLSTIRAMLVGWMLVVIAITRSILRDYFQTTRSVMTLKTAPARPARRSFLAGVPNRKVAQEEKNHGLHLGHRGSAQMRVRAVPLSDSVRTGVLQ